jgi:ubiquinone/menaquinone biosynthesis C-methylase UbiE
MARSKLDTKEWADVDQAKDAEHYVSYLDSVSALEFIQAYKNQTYNLMKVEEGHCVLDIGCGSGDDALKLVEMVGANGRVVGIDYSEVMISEAQKRTEESNLPLEFRVGDVYNLEEADSTFDSCRSDRVFQHLTDPQRALAEMVRVTRPGGRIVVFDPDWETLVVDAPNRSLTRKLVNSICDDRHNGWAGRQLVKYFKQASLTDLIAIPTAVIVPDYATANQIFHFSVAAEALQKSDEVSASQVKDWLNALVQADEIGQFFSSMTGYSVCGKKPL